MWRDFRVAMIFFFFFLKGLLGFVNFFFKNIQRFAEYFNLPSACLIERVYTYIGICTTTAGLVFARNFQERTLWEKFEKRLKQTSPSAMFDFRVVQITFVSRKSITTNSF